MDNKIRVVAMSNYVQPEVKEQPGKDYITFGKKNQFFEHLISRARGSVTNGAIISSVSNLIYGKGLSATNKAQKPNEWAQLLSLFKDDDIRKWISDFEITGQFAIQCQWQGKHKSIKTATHIPIESLAPEKIGDDGEIKAYYFSNNWKKVNGVGDLRRIPVLGESSEGVEVLVVKPYQAGLFYFGLPTWFSAVMWAEIEEEISNYHINNIQHGFAPSVFISFNNSYPDSDEEADKTVKNIQDLYSGSSNAGRAIISWSDDKEHESTITPVALSDASDQYQFLSDEASFKILSAHRIPSPLLIGLPSKTGFSSNAEELKTGSILMESYVLNPPRQIIIKAFDEIQVINGLNLDLFFDPLNPYADEQEAEIEATALSSEVSDLSDDDFNNVLENLVGATPDEDEWDLVDVRVYDEENDSTEDWANRLITSNLSLEVIKSDPNAESRLDKDLYKVRYKYAEKYKKDNSRHFCIQMMGRSERGVVYRYEDITQASFRGVNNEQGHNRQNYSLFKYKGGVNCGHFFNELLYRRKTKTNGEPYEDKALSSSEKVSSIPGYKPKPSGLKESKIAPIDMPNNGHHPNYKSK